MKYSTTATIQICVYPQFTVTFLTETLLIIMNHFYSIKIEIALCSEMSLNVYRTTRRRIPGDSDLHGPRRQNIKFHKTVKSNQTTGGNFKFILPFAPSNYGPNLKVLTSLRLAT